MSAVRIIPEYPGFVISDDGRVQGPSGKWLKASVGGNGYRSFVMAGGACKTVHVAVCTAFHGPRPTSVHEAAHRNGIKTDNRSDNLRWSTRAENEADKIPHGVSNRGTRHGMAKLTAAEVAEIRDLLAAGRMTQWQIAGRYGVTDTAVRSIKTGKTWGWLS